MCSCNQMQWLLAMLTLVRVLVQFTWIVLVAEVVKGVFLHVHVAGLSTVTEVTMTMLELGVKVDLYV